VVVARSRGIEVLSGEGHHDALAGADAVVDDAAGEALLPGPDARLAPTTFDVWLASDGANGDRDGR
jgi:hypothetical protein